MLYIHIPFCESKCYYCDFVSFKHNCNDDVFVKSYIDKLIEEIVKKSVIFINYQISSIYIGGGTPSSISEKYIYSILDNIIKYYNIVDNCEISIECNPNSTNFDKLKLYKSIGINRISVGLQSSNDLELKTLGRIHTYKDFIICYDNIKNVGINNINVDLINGIPNETAKSYENSLLKVLNLQIQHISIYNLIIEKNTKFYKMSLSNELTLPTEEEQIIIDDITYNLTNKFGFTRYEISNYAKEGFRCKHNYGYWDDVFYLGLGLNSSSYLDCGNQLFRCKNKVKLVDYLNLNFNEFDGFVNVDSEINNYKKFFDEFEFINEVEHKKEFIMLSFRKVDGININTYKEKFDMDFEKEFCCVINKYEELNYLKKSNNNIFLTKKGLDISNTIINEFIDILSE